MTIRRRVSRARLLSALAGAAIASCAVGQASYQQYFDDVGPVLSGQHGPSNLIAAGYQFVTLASDARFLAARAAEEASAVRKTGVKAGVVPAY